MFIVPALSDTNKCSNEIYRRYNPDQCMHDTKSYFATSAGVTGGTIALIGGAIALFASGSDASSAPIIPTTTTTRFTDNEVGNDVDTSRLATVINQNSYARNTEQYNDIRLAYSLARGFTGKNSTIAVFDSGMNTYHGKNVAYIASDQVAPDANIVSYEIADKQGNFKSFYEIGDVIASANNANIYNFSWSSIQSYANEVYSRAQIEKMTDKHFVDSLSNAATQKDAIFVWAAGNEYNYQSSSLSALPRVVPELNGHFVNVVAWDSKTDSLADFSNACGITMNYCITAPGTDLKSTQSSKELNGTSFAAPIVSAAIAVIREAFPYMKSSEITELLFATARDLGDAGIDAIYGHGMLDMERATRPVGATTIPLSDNTDVSLQPTRVSSTIGNQLKSKNIKFSFVDSFGRAFETNMNDNIKITNRSIGFERLRDNNINNVKIGNFEIGFKQTNMLMANGFLQTESQDILSFVGYRNEINLGKFNLFYKTTFGTMNPKSSPESMISGFSNLFTASTNIGIAYDDITLSIGTPDTIIGGNMYLHTLAKRNAKGDFIFNNHNINLASEPSIEYSISYKSMTMGFVDNPYGTDEIYVLAKSKIQF